MQKLIQEIKKMFLDAGKLIVVGYTKTYELYYEKKIHKSLESKEKNLKKHFEIFFAGIINFSDFCDFRRIYESKKENLIKMVRYARSTGKSSTKLLYTGNRLNKIDFVLFTEHFEIVFESFKNDTVKDYKKILSVCLKASDDEQDESFKKILKSLNGISEKLSNQELTKIQARDLSDAINKIALSMNIKNVN